MHDLNSQGDSCLILCSPIARERIVSSPYFGGTLERVPASWAGAGRGGRPSKLYSLYCMDLSFIICLLLAKLRFESLGY